MMQTHNTIKQYIYIDITTNQQNKSTHTATISTTQQQQNTNQTHHKLSVKQTTQNKTITNTQPHSKHMNQANQNKSQNRINETKNH